MTSLGDFHATTLDGRDQDLDAYVGDVVLVVNTASKCGLTPQYEGLQKLYDDFAEQGLVVLHQVPDRARRPGDQALRTDQGAAEAASRHRGRAGRQRRGRGRHRLSQSLLSVA